MKSHSTGWIKLTVLAGLGLVLLIPMARITSLIEERMHRRDEARAEIWQRWGGRQVFAGPILEIPFRRAVATAVPGDSRQVGNGFVFREAWLHILPAKLEIETRVEPEIRHRGIFETVVYNANLTVRGSFEMPPGDHLGTGAEELQWSRASLALGLSELRGLRANPELMWGDEQVGLDASTTSDSLFEWGLTSRGLDASVVADGGRVDFELSLVVSGSERLSFLPLGRETEMVMDSPWPNPSFTGSFLPVSHDVEADGFSARWSIPSFGRSYPQVWSTEVGTASELGAALFGSSFGVELLAPVNFYLLTSRCTKYAALFIGLTFAVFFLFELLAGLRIHPIQYLMVGFAMAVFYLLLLAIAEHLGFGTAYLLAAVATVALISGYCATVLGTRGRAALLAGTLTGLYGLLYVLVQLQSYALLVGSIGLFGALAVAMFLTRHVDWYEISAAKPGGEPPGFDDPSIGDDDQLVQLEA